MYRFDSWTTPQQKHETAEDFPRTISGTAFNRFLDLCFSEATAFSFQKGLWQDSEISSLEDALAPYKLSDFTTLQWFGYDLRSTPPGSEWKMHIHLYEACSAAKEILKAHLQDIFMGYTQRNDAVPRLTLEDLCFLKGNEIIVGTVAHELILHAYPPSKAFTQELQTIGSWEHTGFSPPELLFG